jgi:transitional endoplasmic reticulum ATPase
MPATKSVADVTYSAGPLNFTPEAAMHKYEQKMLWTLVRNLLRHLPARHPAIDDLFLQGDELFVLGRNAKAWLKARALRDEHTEWVPPEYLTETHVPLRWHELAERECRALGRVRPSAVRRRLELVGRLFGIDAVGLSILEWMYLKESSTMAGDLVRVFERICPRAAVALSAITGHSVVAIERRLAPGGLLKQHGLLTACGYMGIDPLPDPGPIVRRLLSQPLRSAADVRGILLGHPLHAALGWEDFEHLGENARFLVELLAGALEQGERGVSVLLHGPPGTGKTEFARTLAARMETDLYALGEEDNGGSAPNARERLGCIQLAQSLLREHCDALLLIDEAEDVLSGSFAVHDLSGFVPMQRGPQTGRVFLHRLLENAPAPMLWICNHVGGIDPAVLRRFSYVMEVQPPSRRSRQRVWQRSLAQYGYRDCEQMAARCAELPVTPGIAAQAVRSARIAGRGAEAVEQVARQLGQGVSGRPLPRRAGRSTRFSLELVCCDQDISDLTEHLAGLKDPRFSVCVDGPPGTGKSAWVRHLAERLDMEVRLRRASDLLDMYVGGTEANIARAFAQAQAAGELLVFDEADSFLRDRRGAQRSWEVTAVNEMLTWMESHPLPFACTTNLLDAVDPAAMRRFTFKLRFGHLDEARVRTAFRCFFGADWPATVPVPDRLAPGDFAVVEQRAQIEGMDDAVRLARMLVEECRYKPGQSRGMGFLQSAG